MGNPFAFGHDEFDSSNRFVTSWFLPPWVLFACRLLFVCFPFSLLPDEDDNGSMNDAMGKMIDGPGSISFNLTKQKRNCGTNKTPSLNKQGLYALTTQFVSIGTQVALGQSADATAEFSYFTVLTYWGIAFYLLVSAVHTATYAATGRPLLARFPRSLQALHSLYYTTVSVYPFIVTIVYWGVLYVGPWFNTTFSAWSNVSRHAMNSGFALFEILVARTDLPPWIHLFWLIIILCLYLALAYVTHATKGFYVYPFLDPAGGAGKLAAYICGIAVGCIVIFLLVLGLIWLRKWVTERKLGMRGKLSSRDRPASSTISDPETAQHGKYDR
ncbi:hypothetical protein OOU_Y34scaffold00654g30 [Pyricularia oryzae Y34]|uniref:FAR-17a/AIG1-like protein n=2 Tax=Pyricularia oryzae TaxID=318829 RepID=A0AA97PJ87_PYRO3|nr:hypothetical protein OOU_Y34scaffold00654g30 [Pyricularia oryzae Y34]